MKGSKGRSMKHTHFIHCEDQRSQEHKKIVRDRLEGNTNNSFRTREIPIKRLFNVGHFTNASEDVSKFSKGKNFSAGMNVMDYDLPELVVFIQEDHEQFVKDSCIGRGVPPEDKCLSEDCALDHDIMSCHFESNMNRRSDSNLGTMEAFSINSNRPEYGSKHLSLKDAMEFYDSRALVIDVEGDSGYKILTDHPTKKTTPETLREALTKEAYVSRSLKNWQINSFLGTVGSRVEFPCCADCVQVADTIMCRSAISNSQSPTGLGKRQENDPPETCSCAVGPQSSGPTSYAAPATSSASHHSNDSISSTHSFAFPILPEEWNGSPVRMLEADKSQIRKDLWQKKRLMFKFELEFSVSLKTYKTRSFGSNNNAFGCQICELGKIKVGRSSPITVPSPHLHPHPVPKLATTFHAQTQHNTPLIHHIHVLSPMPFAYVSHSPFRPSSLTPRGVIILDRFHSKYA
ncbi:unnamed protein product [Sphenostylis stenocarpa]|uniref:Uncharacterized protein n=1 Tax=Sphenostylis stenocarpa TaxID=92480 RepID=A0AA86TB44_9FABA|nr:unnamed protein product [Sphenostylis stenocarpa]